MKLKFFKSVWGMEGTLESQFSRIAQAGYDGIEANLPSAENENQFKELLHKYELEFILQINTYGDHISTFEEQVHEGLKYQPMLINSHSAKDSMPYEEQVNFFEKAVAIEKQVEVPICHETHRSRPLFTPWTTAQLLRDIPDLKINADFSHWCCVCESLLEGHEENVQLAIERAILIHSRVGYAQGPQVPDPRAPEYKRELEVHESWWDRIIAHAASKGCEYFPITSEFGPPGYMHTLPYTNQPVANLWDVCLWMKNRLEEKYTKYTI